MDDPAATVDDAGAPLEQWFDQLDALLAERGDVEDDRAALLATLDAAIFVIRLRQSEITRRIAELKTRYPNIEEECGHGLR
jgi:hypothetical protein